MDIANSQLIASLKPCFYARSIVMKAPRRLTEKNIPLVMNFIEKQLYCLILLPQTLIILQLVYKGLQWGAIFVLIMNIGYPEFCIPLPLFTVYSYLKFT